MAQSENVNFELVSENLKEVINYLGLTTNSFAALVGIDSSNLSKKLKGQQPWTTKDFVKMSNKNISVEYLTHGQGPMTTGPVRYPSYQEDTGKAVPVFNDAFACGYRGFEDEPSVRPVGYIDMPMTRGALCWCSATGTSMQPLINNGDYVCLWRVDDWQDFIIFGEIYAIDFINGDRTIKWVEKGANDNEFILVPENKEVSTQSINKRQIRNMFRVKGVMKLY